MVYFKDTKYGSWEEVKLEDIIIGLFNRYLLDKKLTELLKPFLNLHTNLFNIITNSLHVFAFKIHAVEFLFQFQFIWLISHLCLAHYVLVQLRVNCLLLLIKITGKQKGRLCWKFTDVVEVVLLQCLTCCLYNVIQSCRLLGLSHFYHEIST